MFDRKFYNAGKDKQSKDSVWRHVSVCGRNVQERKVFCRVTRKKKNWKVLQLAKSSLVLKRLTFVNIFAKYQ